jgi:hypothetical protein
MNDVCKFNDALVALIDRDRFTDWIPVRMEEKRRR